MAAPAFGTIGTLFGSTTSTPAFAVPASVAAGDIIVVAFYSDLSTTTITGFPAGFAEAENSPRTVDPGGSFPYALHVAWKRASGSDSGTYSFTLSASVFVQGNAVRYTGCVAAGNPWDSPTAAGNGGAVNSTTTPDIAVTTLGSDRMLFFLGGDSNGDGGTWSAPAGFNQRQGGASVSVAEISDLVQAAAGSSGNRHATNTATGRVGDWMGALIGTTVDGRVPYNPQRYAQARDYGESQWIQKDRRNANLVATAANDLDVPLLLADTQRQGYATSVRIDRRLVPQQPDRHLRALDATAANDLAQPLFQPVDGRYWHLYNDVALRTWRPQQRTYYDISQLVPPVAMPSPPPQRTIPPRDPGEVQWHQLAGRDPSLLTTAQLENELLGGGDTARHYTWAASRRIVPQQRQYFDVSLLATALLEGPLVWIRPQQFMADRREVPQQRPYISDPSFYPVAGATDPLTLAWGAGGNYWHLYNDVRVERREVPQQRAYVSDPSLLVPAVADFFYVPPRQPVIRSAWMPQQRQLESPPGLLDTALLESPLLVGSFRQTFTERRVYPRQFVWLGQIPEIADPLLVGNGVGGDTWRRYNTPATHDDRRLVPQQPLRQTFYYTADLGLGPNVPFVDTTPSGTFVSESGTGQTQQTIGIAIVSEGGVVIVSQTLGGVL